MNNFSDFFNNKKDTTDFYIALVVIGLFLGTGVFFSSDYFNNQSFISSTFSDQPSNNEDFLVKNAVDQALISTLLSHPKQVKKLDLWLDKTPKMDSLVQADSTLIVDFPVKDTVLVDTILNEIDTIRTENAIDSTSEVIDSAVARKIENEPVIEATEPTKEVEDTTKSASKPQPTPPIAQSKPSNNTSNYDCIILVGAFSVSSTAEKLKKKLLQQGYPASTFFRKGNRVVGIKHSCKNEAKLQQTLKKIKATYPEAWILRK